LMLLNNSNLRKNIHRSEHFPRLVQKVVMYKNHIKLSDDLRILD
jgi:hypothetical protein